MRCRLKGRASGRRARGGAQRAQQGNAGGPGQGHEGKAARTNQQPTSAQRRRLRATGQGALPEGAHWHTERRSETRETHPGTQGCVGAY